MSKNMLVKWYMRVWLVFYAKQQTVQNFTRKGEGLRVTLDFKVYKGKQYLYAIKEELYNLKGKHNKIARRKAQNENK